MQRARRHTPYPLTWEIPLGIACAILFTLAVGVHLGDAGGVRGEARQPPGVGRCGGGVRWRVGEGEVDGQARG